MLVKPKSSLREPAQNVFSWKTDIPEDTVWSGSVYFTWMALSLCLSINLCWFFIISISFRRLMTSASSAFDCKMKKDTELLQWTWSYSVSIQSICLARPSRTQRS